MNLLKFVFLLTISCCVVNCAKILCVFVVPSISHQVVYQVIWKELSLRGHEVTVITPNPLNDPKLINLTEIDVSSAYDTMLKTSSKFSKTVTHWKMIEMLPEIMLPLIEQELSHPEVQKLINDHTKTFDVVLVEFLNPIPSAFSVRFNCPFIGVASLSVLNVDHEAAGNPVHPILHSDLMTTFGDKLSFYERVDSVLYYLWFRWCNRDIMFRMDTIARKYFGNDLPYLEDIQKNVSMLFLNTNPVIHKARAYPPNVIEMGRMHIKPKKPLPQDLKAFLDSSTEGVVYFSLGSNVKSVFINPNIRQIIMEAFAEIPYKVLWKFENDTLPGKPKNVKINKWLPQQDLLGHPNIKLFITQGGLQSMEEAIANRVPLLGLPFFADQFFNVDRIKTLGIGLHLNFQKLNKKEFVENILEIAQNPKYKNKIDEIAGLMEDQPMNGLEKAVWWTEYVIRHKGAAHLRNPAASMSWYQFLLIDVISFLLAVILIIIYLLYIVISFIRKQFLVFNSDKKKKQ